MSSNINLPFLEGMKTPANHKEEDLEQLRQWQDTQAHLPKLNDDHLHLFLHSCYGKIERTKLTIENYFTIRTHCTDLFSKWDPNSTAIQRMLNVGTYTKCTRRTPEGYSILLYRLNETEACKFEFNNAMKLFFMFNDMILSEEQGLSPGFIVVFDMKGVSLGHMTTINLSSIRTFMNYIQEGHPARLKGVHVINSVSFIDKVLALVKPFIKSELMSMVHFHGPPDSLSKYLPLETLPSDYGGKSEETPVLHAKYRKLMESRYASYFEQLTSLKVDETKRVKVKKRCRFFGNAEGSFRSLSID